MTAQQAIKVAAKVVAGDLTTDMVRGFARPQPHHAMGELTSDEASCFRAICAETLAHRLTACRYLRETATVSAFASPADDLVPNNVLYEFARPSIQIEPGQLSSVEVAIGSLYFSDICGELLAYRLAEGIQ